MKIAIHHTPGSFSDHWIKYCNERIIPYKTVNCYNSDIISQVDDCNGLMWHWDLNDYKANLFARQLTLALETKGIKVFPDVNTAWHYDDKAGQKYLLEAIEAPLINSHLFFSKEDAFDWAAQTSFPKVFKLRGGAGSSNVKLVKNNKKAEKLIKKAFGTGFPQINRISRLKERFWMLKRDKNLTALKKVFTGIARLFLSDELEKFSQKEKGYIYFQDYIPFSKSDARLVVIGNRCFGITRYCRTGDFRASGSGLKDYNPELIDTECVELAFKTSNQLKTQSAAFDFILDNKSFKIIELSYAFVSEKFPGYWDTNLCWHEGEVSPQKFMIEDFIHSIKNSDE